MKLLKKRITIVALVLLLTFSALGLTLLYDAYFNPGKQFASVKENLFHEFYDNDGLSINFSFYDKTLFSDSACGALPIFEKENYESDSCKRYLCQLGRIKKESLSAKDQTLYNHLFHYFTLHQNDQKFLYYDNPLKPTGGVQTQLPILLAQFPIHDAKDVTYYFHILESIPDYFSSLSDYMRIRKAKGITIATADLDEIIHQCDEMKGPKGKALFYDSFSSIINDDALGFSMTERKRFLNRCDSILDSYVMPSYENLADSLYLLKDDLLPRKGLCRQGASDYYTLLLQEQTGSNKTLPQIESMLKDRFSKLYPSWEYECTLLSNTDLKKLEFDLSSDPQTILNTLQDYMQDKFPSLDTDIRYEVKNVPLTLSQYAAPAFYFTPQIDNFQSNIIYVNQPELSTRADLFTTLAHEGYPGHMLQANYFFQRGHLPVIDTALYQATANTGYVEGWALYTELSSYDYLSSSDCIKDEIKSHYYSALQLQRELMICLYCMLDIRVHIYGDEADDLLPYLAKLGLNQPDLAENLFIYLINEPTTYASYYVGYLELVQIKEQYMNACEQTNRPYTEKDFHEFFLSCGPISYEEIKNLTAAYFSNGLLHFASNCVIIPFGHKNGGKYEQLNF